MFIAVQKGLYMQCARRCINNIDDVTVSDGVNLADPLGTGLGVDWTFSKPVSLQTSNLINCG